MTDLATLLSSLSPEELEQLLGMGTLDERGTLLEQQLQQAEALRNPSGQGHLTGLGGALGGFSNAVRDVQGAYTQGKLREQQAALLAQKDAGRGLYVDALRRYQTAGQQPTQDVTPPTPFAL